MACSCENCSCNLPGKAASIWIATTPETAYPALEPDRHFDVAVLGGGISGITTAYFLQKAGLKVAVIEADRIASRVTGNTTAKISAVQSVTYAHLQKSVGDERAKQYAGSQLAGLQLINRIIQEQGIGCHFERQDAYLFAERPEELQQVRQEAELAQQYGLPVTMTDTVPLSFPTAGGLICRDQAQFHPRKYLLKLAEGLTVYERTRITAVHDGAPCRVETEHGDLTADYVVLATHFPVGDHSWYSARLQPNASYVLAMELDQELPRGMFMGVDGFTVRAYENLAVINGNHHRTGENPDPKSAYALVETYARERFKVKEVKYRWTTHDLKSSDHLPYIGKYSPLSQRLYVATGFGGWGMANGTLAGQIICDLIQGKSNEYAELFSPERSNLTTVGAVAAEGVHSAGNVAQRFVENQAESVSELKPGDGAVMEIGGHKLAVARDGDGELHKVSPVCTHLGCTVEWNPVEGTWDCPCHGSRFTIDGQVLYGPATKPLKHMQ